MKTTTLVLILFLTATSLWAQTPPTPLTPAQRLLLLQQARAKTNNPAGASAALPALPGFSAPAAGAPASAVPATAPAISTTTPGRATVSPDNTAAPGEEAAGYKYDFPGVDVNQVLEIYADLVGRTLIRGPVPQATITLKTQSPLTKTEAIEALQAVLGLNGITFVNIGEKFVKVLPPEQAAGAGGSLDSTDAAHLPEMGPYVTHIVQLKYVKPSVMAPLIQPFGRLANSITPIDDNGILVIRDYAENVKRMLEMIAKIDVSVPAEYISAVIPIRYAQAADIANVLNSLGGSGGATVSVGGSTTAPPISGMANRPTGTGLGGMGSTTPLNGVNTPGSPPGQPRPTTANPNGTPSSATPFQQRLISIINRAGSAGGAGGEQQPIQIFGQAKIIADERANSLLVYATRQDMDAITNVIAKLDVLLPAVLIEALVIDYDLGPNTLNFGVSAAQNPQNYGGGLPVVGGGGFNNGPSLLNSLSSQSTVPSSTSNNIVSSFASSLGSGFSYFGNIGPNGTWHCRRRRRTAMPASSSVRASGPQAKPAQFFVGDTVPYITGYGNYGYGNQSTYSQLSVGVELDVTPFINPDGLVVMDIQQEIDDISGYTSIDNNQVPNTIKRTLNSEIAVRDKDTIMLGGFIKNQKSTSKSGVPFLQSIPLFGNLFSSRSDSKKREELIVLMRPTVLKTPEIAAANTITEERRLPGVSAAAAEESTDEHKIIEAERKKELKHPQDGGFYVPAPTNSYSEQLSQPQVQSDGFFTPVAPNAPVVPANTNNAAPPPP